MKKALVYFGVIFLGAVIVTAIDHLVGISFKDVDVLAVIIHKITYMLWGGALLSMNKWFG